MVLRPEAAERPRAPLAILTAPPRDKGMAAEVKEVATGPAAVVEAAVGTAVEAATPSLGMEAEAVEGRAMPTQRSHPPCHSAQMSARRPLQRRGRATVTQRVTGRQRGMAVRAACRLSAFHKDDHPSVLR